MDTVIWQNQTYYGIHRFDCHEVALYTYPNGKKENNWGYHTVLPISPAEFRRQNPTKAKVKIENGAGYVIFIIFDDWGDKYVMMIPNEMYHEISAAIEGAKKNELL